MEKRVQADGSQRGGRRALGKIRQTNKMGQEMLFADQLPFHTDNRLRAWAPLRQARRAQGWRPLPTRERRAPQHGPRDGTGAHRRLPALLRWHRRVGLNSLKFTQRLFMNLSQVLFQREVAVG